MVRDLVLQWCSWKTSRQGQGSNTTAWQHCMSKSTLKQYHKRVGPWKATCPSLYYNRLFELMTTTQYYVAIAVICPSLSVLPDHLDTSSPYIEATLMSLGSQNYTDKSSPPHNRVKTVTAPRGNTQHWLVILLTTWVTTLSTGVRTQHKSYREGTLCFTTSGLNISLVTIMPGQGVKVKGQQMQWTSVNKV